MSIAWGSLVLLVLLLPGVLFFVGLQFPEQFTRETVERSPLGQLAAVLLVSLFIHGVLFWIAPLLCGGWLPCVDLKVFLDTLSMEPRDQNQNRALAAHIHQYREWILGYLLLTCVLGVITGWIMGGLAVRGHLKNLTQHTWIYDLSVGDNFTVAYVMTNVRQDDRILMYQGFLKAFALQRDGRFSYLVLTDAVRGYMHLEATGARTSDKTDWRAIGETAGVLPAVSAKTPYTRRDRSYLVIEGEDVANVVFDRLAFDFTKAFEEGLLKEILKKVEAEVARISDQEETRKSENSSPAT